MTPDWSPQQIAALDRVTQWFGDENSPQVFRLFGFAGTGKTTLAVEIANRVRAMVKDKQPEAMEDDERIRRAVLFGAFTGKAALVLQSKGCRGASTIHSLIYRLDEESGGQPVFVLAEDSKLKEAKLLIVDEVSMVGAELAADLLSFKVKVLALGDPAQLPPGRVMLCKGRRIVGYCNVEELAQAKTIAARASNVCVSPLDWPDLEAWLKS